MNRKPETFVLVRFTRKSGRIDTTLEAVGNALLKLWALRNTTKTKDCIIFSKTTGQVVYYTEGTGNFPDVQDKDLGNIEKYCPGLLAEIQKQSAEEN